VDHAFDSATMDRVWDVWGKTGPFVAGYQKAWQNLLRLVKPFEAAAPFLMTW